MDEIEKIILEYLKEKDEYVKDDILDKKLKALIKNEIETERNKNEKPAEISDSEIEDKFLDILQKVCYKNNFIIKKGRDRNGYKYIIFKENLLNLVVYLIKNYEVGKIIKIDKIHIDNSELKELFTVFEISKNDADELYSYSTSGNNESWNSPEKGEGICEIIFGDSEYFVWNVSFDYVQDKIYRKINVGFLYKAKKLDFELGKKEKKLKELNKKIKNVRSKLEKSEIGIITVMGIFVSLFTLISTNVSFFKEATSGRGIYEIIALFTSINLVTIFSVGFLVWVIKYFIKDGNNLSSEKSVHWGGIIFSVIIIGLLSFFAGQGINMKTEPKERTIKIKYEGNL